MIILFLFLYLLLLRNLEIWRLLVRDIWINLLILLTLLNRIMLIVIDMIRLSLLRGVMFIIINIISTWKVRRVLNRGWNCLALNKRKSIWLVMYLRSLKFWDLIWRVAYLRTLIESKLTHFVVFLMFILNHYFWVED